MSRQRSNWTERSAHTHQVETEEHSYRMKELLKTDLAMLEEENAILKLKCKKVSQLEDKVEIVLKQNAQLLTENEKMSKLLQQEKSNAESLKGKCESLTSHKMGSVSEYDQQKRKLLQNIQHLEDELAQAQALKASQINELKSQQHMQIQNLKRQFRNSEDTYEVEIRKLKDQLDKRNLEVTEYGNKLKRISSETDYEILKLKEDREKLRNQLAYTQADHSKEIESLRFKLQNNFAEELDATKRSHLISIDDIHNENARLRDGLDERSRQIEQLGLKINKQRAYYEDTISYLKRDVDNYRQQILEMEKVRHLDLGDLREKMLLIHETEIQEMQVKHRIYIQSMQEQIFKLQAINQDKNLEIEQLIKDKATARNSFQAEVTRLKEDIASLQNKYKDLEFRYSEESSQASSRLSDRQKHIEYLEDIIKSQKSNTEIETSSYQKVINQLKEELASLKAQIKEKQYNWREEVSKIKSELQEKERESEEKEGQYEQKFKQLKDELYGASSELNNHASNLHSRNVKLQEEIHLLKSTITSKDKEIKSISQRMKAASSRQTKFEAEVLDLRNKIVKREEKSNQLLAEQKKRLEETFKLALERIKADHQSVLKIQISKNSAIQEDLDNKQSQLEHLLKLYSKISQEFQDLTEQQANKKEFTLKYAGATPDVIAAKNLFDIYLKTKVMQVCGDALKDSSSK